MRDQPMRLTIVRHADAGARAGFDGPDDERPLTARGHAQAAALVPVLSSVEVAAIVSSPARRCLETVEPLAAHVGLSVGTLDALAEDSTGKEAIEALIARSDEVGGLVVGSTHGPIFEDLFAGLGGESDGPHRRPIAKAGRVELWIVGGEIVDLQAFPPPEVRK